MSPAVVCCIVFADVSLFTEDSACKGASFIVDDTTWTTFGSRKPYSQQHFGCSSGSRKLREGSTSRTFSNCASTWGKAFASCSFSCQSLGWTFPPCSRMLMSPASTRARHFERDSECVVPGGKHSGSVLGVSCRSPAGLVVGCRPGRSDLLCWWSSDVSGFCPGGLC